MYTSGGVKLVSAGLVGSSHHERQLGSGETRGGGGMQSTQYQRISSKLYQRV